MSASGRARPTHEDFNVQVCILQALPGATTMGSAPSACCSLPTMMANSNLLLQLFIQGRAGRAKAAHGPAGLPEPRLGPAPVLCGEGPVALACPQFCRGDREPRAAPTASSLAGHTPGRPVASRLPRRCIEDRPTRIPAAPNKGRSDSRPVSTGNARCPSACPGSGALPGSRPRPIHVAASDPR